MLIVETIARIRREHFVQGKTIKEIARDHSSVEAPEISSEPVPATAPVVGTLGRLRGLSGGAEEIRTANVSPTLCQESGKGRFLWL